MNSLIIPVYNYAAHVEETLQQLQAASLGLSEPLEVILVDDGSTDTTVSMIEKASYPWLQLLRLDKNTGKGGAIAAAVKVARGNYILFTDADLPYDLSAIEDACAALRAGNHMVIGSRRLMHSSSAVAVPPMRQLSSKLFSLLANRILLYPIPDTQCGFKAFTRETALHLFEGLHMQRFCFDVELLYKAQVSGYRIMSTPVLWIHNAESTVSLKKDTFIMVKDLILLFLRIHFSNFKKTILSGRATAPVESNV